MSRKYVFNFIVCSAPQELNKEIYEGEGDESRKSSHIARMSLMKTPKK